MGDDLDPFGRRKDENPLASLGWQGDETASTAAEPASDREREPEPAALLQTATTADEARPRTPRRTGVEGGAARWRSPRRDHSRPRVVAVPGPVGQIVRTVIALGIVIAVGGALLGVFADEGVKRAERFVDKLSPPDVQAPSVPGDENDAAAPDGGASDRTPRGLSSGSLLRPAAFGRAMSRLRAGGYGRLANLRVAPERIDATLVTKGGRLRQVQIVPGGAVRVIGTTPAGFAGTRTMALKGIVAAAPSRLTRSAAGRLRQPASRVNYLVLSEFAGARQWNVYFKGGQIFSADARGRVTRRIS